MNILKEVTVKIVQEPLVPSKLNDRNDSTSYLEWLLGKLLQEKYESIYFSRVQDPYLPFTFQFPLLFLCLESPAFQLQ